MDESDARATAVQALESGQYMDAVRHTMDWFASCFPGRSVEVRVPPYRVVQVLGGTTHRRGTPPAVVEMSPEIWLGLVARIVSWDECIANGKIRASGQRSDLGSLFTG